MAQYCCVVVQGHEQYGNDNEMNGMF